MMDIQMVTQAEIEAAAHVMYDDDWETSGRDGTPIPLLVCGHPEVIDRYKARAKAALEAAARARWQEIGTAPKDGTVIIVQSNDKCRMAKYEHGCWMSVPGTWQLHPTYWQVQPSPPEK